jgi:LmbE family N-acetylglucosaminyl deacetylase
MKKKDKILVFAAHPDDEVLGCGGTIAKLSKQYEISIICMTNGVDARKHDEIVSKKLVLERQKAAKISSKILKCKNIFFLDFPDNQMDSVPLLKIVKQVESFIAKIKPKIIFTHRIDDLNIDHEITNRAVVTATRPEKKNKVDLTLFFDIPSSTEWNMNGKKKNIVPQGNWYEDTTNTFSLKIKAIKAYKSELRNSPHPRSLKGIKSFDSWRGSIVGKNYAESFLVGRYIK